MRIILLSMVWMFSLCGFAKEKAVYVHDVVAVFDILSQNPELRKPFSELFEVEPGTERLILKEVPAAVAEKYAQKRDRGQLCYFCCRNVSSSDNQFGWPPCRHDPCRSQVRDGDCGSCCLPRQIPFNNLWPGSPF